MTEKKEKDVLALDIERLRVICMYFFEKNLSVDQINQVTLAMAGLRTSLESWARLVVELTHEKYMAEAEVERLRAEMAGKCETIAAVIEVK